MSARALDQIAAAVDPPSDSHAAAARQALAGRDGLGALEAVAITLAAARHAALPPVDRKLVAVVAAGHGIAAAEAAGTAARVREIAAGAALVNVLARAAGARVAVIDAGLAAEAGALGPGVLSMPVAAGTADIGAGPAMTRDQALDGLDTGIALVLSLAGEGLDLLALGQVGAGADAAATAVVDALARPGPAPDPVDALARCGGHDLSVLAGMCLSAAAIRIPIVLDGAVTPIAALLAARIAPNTVHYLIAGHTPATAAARRALSALDLAPLLDARLTAGEGAGAALALPAIDAAARLLREPRDRKRLPLAP